MGHIDDNKDYLIAKNRLNDKNDPILNYKEAAAYLKKNKKDLLRIRHRKEVHR